MNETILSIYFIIGIIYASISLNRHWNTSQKRYDKIFLWVLLCVCWIIFILSDIIKQNTNYQDKDYNNNSTFVIKQSPIPLSIINDHLIKAGITPAETVLKIPYLYTNQLILTYKGDIKIIQSLTQKKELLKNIIEYHDGFTSLSSMKQNIPENEVSVYLLWGSNKKLIGVLTLSDNKPFIMNLYYGDALPAVFSQL